MKKRKSIYKESSLSRIQKHALGHDTGILTAFRYATDCGDGDLIYKKENLNNNYKLRGYFLSKGYGVTAVDGAWKSNDTSEVSYEDSYFIVDLKDTGNLKKDLIKMGVKFDQDAVLYSPHGGSTVLISTNTCPNAISGRGVIGKTSNLGKHFFGKDGEMFTRVNGRPFIFKENHRLVVMKNLSIPEIRSALCFAKEAEAE